MPWRVPFLGPWQHSCVGTAVSGAFQTAIPLRIPVKVEVPHSSISVSINMETDLVSINFAVGFHVQFLNLMEVFSQGFGKEGNDILLDVILLS